MAPPPQKQPSSKTLVCGFFRPDRVVVAEADVRNAVAAEAAGERSKKWLAGGSLQKEDDPARFGDLVGYWLAGSKGNVRPDRLVAAQQAAVASTSSYGTLVHSALATAVGRFKAEAVKADAAIAAVYTAWEAIDKASVVVKAAAAKEKAAAADEKAAKAAIKTATAAVRSAEAGVKAKTAPQSVVDAANADLTSARSALAAATTVLGTAQRGHKDARKALQNATRVRDTAKATHKTAVSARNGLEDAAKKIADRNKQAVRKKLVAAAPSGSLSGLDATLENALLHAHEFSADIDAWSAVFVGACVRAAAIKLKLEGVAGGNHQGLDGLLSVSFRHADYIVTARDRKKGKQGAYHAFEPTGRIIKKGDIIATDRVDEIKVPIALPRLVSGRNLHCDIVIDIKTGGAQPYAETVGGNVAHTVRRRRYPLTAAGELIVSSTHCYIQEDDSGQFGAFNTLLITPSVLPPRSTRRVFAVLSLVEGCDTVEEGESTSIPGISTRHAPSEIDRRSPWRVLTGEGDSMVKALERLESPFLDEEILPTGREQFARVQADETSAGERDGELLEQLEHGDEYEGESSYDAENPDEEDQSAQEHGGDLSAEWEAALLEADEDEQPYAHEEPDTLFEREDGELGPADSIDEAAAQCLLPQSVKDRLEPLLDAAGVRSASAWNGARHPAKSGVARATLLTRLERYVNRSAVENAMRKADGLKDLAGDAQAVLAVVAHQFQQKIYTSKPQHDGKIGEGTLDALGFVRHRDDGLNTVDALNTRFHVKGRSKAFQRLQEVYRTERAAFEQLGADVSPKTWYRLFVNAPFLGRPFTKGIHIELMRRLRLAEKWLLGQPLYRTMSPVELGAALNIDEDHHGGRTTTNNSMHTLGLAVDIRYVKNPWVAGQHGNDGKPNTGRNSAFQAVSRNVSRLMSGTDEAWTPAWLHGLGSDTARTTESAFNEIQKRQTSLQVYLSLENDAGALTTTITRRSHGLNPERVIKPREAIAAAVERWRKTIKGDRKRLEHAFGPGRRPEAGFMNLERSLVCALRDHACLAWGAIDLGANANGDMMHFDCRATGIGWKLSLERQRTAGANHPCVSATAAVEEMETPDAPSVQGGAVPFLGGRRWTFTSSTLPMKIGIFCPKVIGSPKSVEVLVYAHGHLDPCPPVPKTMPDDLITAKPFELGKLVDASNREIVLVVPFLDWGNLKTNNLKFEACFRDNMHVLGTPAKLNGVVREVLGEVGRVFGTAAPSLQNLILAGHSRAYDFFDPLAMAHGDPEMSKGALAKLSGVWALDTTYTCPTDHWLCWLASKPALRMSVFFRGKSKTEGCGKRFAGVAGKTGKRLQVMAVGESHCAVPVRRLPKLLNPGGTVAPKTSRELDEEREAFAWDEHMPVNRQEARDADEEATWADPEAEAEEYHTDEDGESLTGEQNEADGEALEDLAAGERDEDV